MKKANLPEPIFENQRNDFTLIFYNGKYPELLPETIKNNSKRNIRTIKCK